MTSSPDGYSNFWSWQVKGRRPRRTVWRMMTIRTWFPIMHHSETHFSRDLCSSCVVSVVYLYQMFVRIQHLLLRWINWETCINMNICTYELVVFTLFYTNITQLYNIRRIAMSVKRRVLNAASVWRLRRLKPRLHAAQRLPSSFVPTDRLTRRRNTSASQHEKILFPHIGLFSPLSWSNTFSLTDQRLWWDTMRMWCSCCHLNKYQ